MKNFTIFTFIVILSAALASKPKYSNPNGVKASNFIQQEQYLTCYDSGYYLGDNIFMVDYIDDLRTRGWNDRFSSCCFNGVWLLYDETDYNEDDFQAEEFDGWGENYCTQFTSRFDNLASSVRLAGAPNGYKYSTLNLYEGERFMGAEHFYYDYDDASMFTLDNVMSSAIVTGCDPWTIYEYDDYRGDSVCLFPSDINNCYPGFFPFKEDLKGMANRGSSARVGCYSQKKIIGKNSTRV